MNEQRWTQGTPQCRGVYRCKLEDGRIVLVDHYPGEDSEAFPDGEIIEGITGFQRLAGQRYAKLRLVGRR